MKYLKENNLEEVNLPGRIIKRAVGKEGPIESGEMTVGFASYSAHSGSMEPHHHAEETVYIVDAKDGWVRYGSKNGNLRKKVNLEAGMILYFDELEWHVFEHAQDGFVKIIFIYGQVDNIRPEEIR